MGERPVWLPTALGSATRRNTHTTPHTTMRPRAWVQFPVSRSMTAQGTMMVPEPMMGMKSSTARARASSTA